MNGNDTKRDKIERKKLPIRSVDVRLDEIEKWGKNIGEDIDKLQASSLDLKKELAQFVFQTVSATMGLFAILLAVLIGFSTNWDFEETGIDYVIGLLLFLTILLIFWFAIWLYCNLKEK